MTSQRVAASEAISIYCDESCHLEHDASPVMLLGAVWCPQSDVKRNSLALKRLKERHQARGELKWARVSPSREQFFLDVVSFFFDTANLNFRCLIVGNKQALNHSYYNQGSHDSFYYKMYFYLLRNIMSPRNLYRIYLDIKDTRSQVKINRLRDVLCKSFGDFEGRMIDRIQHTRSTEVELLQITDFLTGAISYKKRRLTTNRSKLAVVDRISQLSGLSLEDTSPPWETKFNLFHFLPRRSRS